MKKHTHTQISNALCIFALNLNIQNSDWTVQFIVVAAMDTGRNMTPQLHTSFSQC